MALTLTPYATGQGFGLSRLAFDIPASSVSANARGPLWTMRSTDDTKIIVGVLQSSLTSVNSAVFPNDSDEQDYDTAAAIVAARAARSAAQLDGVNYIFDSSGSPTASGIRLLNADGTVPAGAPIVVVSSVDPEAPESLVSNASTGFLYCSQRINATAYNILQIDPVLGTSSVVYVASHPTVHFAFNGAGDRFYLATNDTPTTNFRIEELAYPAFTLVQSHLIGNFNVEAILAYNPPNGAATRIIAQYYTGSSSQFWDIDLATDTPTALTSGSIAGDGMNVDPVMGRRAFITQRNEVYKLLAPEGGSFTDSAPPNPTDPPDAPTGLGRPQGDACTGCTTVLTWMGVDGATGYRAYWRFPGLPWNRFYDGTETTATHAPVLIGTEYQYAVTAYNDDGESAYSNVIAVVPCCVQYAQIDRCDTSYSETEWCETVYRSEDCCG